MKKLFSFTTLMFLVFMVSAQQQTPAEQFWNNLKKHCGNAYQGTLTEAPANDQFSGKKLIMQIRACNGNTIRIPFLVGDDRSRTWVLTFENGRITLKHDHRHEDGSEDKVTQYGGTATNPGLPTIQIFPADQQTSDLIPHASANVWWITLDDSSFTYNLRRIGTDRLFSITFDLSKKIASPEPPWGWKN